MGFQVQFSNQASTPMTQLSRNKKSSLPKIIADKEYDFVTKIPADSSDLVVFSAVKKLTSYVILVTEKSPKHFRGVLVNKMQSYCIDCLELLFKANLILVSDEITFSKRQDLQIEAISKLKLLGYMSLNAESIDCILQKQFKQISILLADSINLIAAWRKSDADKWKNKQGIQAEPTCKSTRLLYKKSFCNGCVLAMASLVLLTLIIT